MSEPLEDPTYRFEDRHGDVLVIRPRHEDLGELFVKTSAIGAYLPLSEVPALIAALTGMLPDQPVV